MSAKQDLICTMAAQVMTKIMTNSDTQNREYIKEAVRTAILIYDRVQTEVPAAEPVE